jgi:5-carboxymethyl-2-hydroxymuconic-semialdehyde dehydrogenase
MAHATDRLPLSASSVRVGPQQHYVGGAFRLGLEGRTFETLDPTTNEPIAEVAEGLAADVDLAVRAARRAFDEGPWPRLRASERAAVLRRIAEAIRDAAEDFVGLEILDIGMPVR